MKRKKLKAVVLILLVVSASGGCNAHEGRSSSVVTKMPLPPAMAARLELHLDRYDLTFDETAIIQRAYDKAIKRCMAEYGHSLRMPPVRIPKTPKNAVIMGQLGAFDPSKYGYHGPPGSLQDRISASRNMTETLVVPPEMVDVFSGTPYAVNGKRVPDGGCDGMVRRLLSDGSKSVTFPVAAGPVVPEKGIDWFKLQVLDQAKKDPQYSATVKAWKVCMADAGIKHYDSPEAAEWDSRWGLSPRTSTDPSATIQDAERKTAAADKRCRTVVSYTNRIYQLMLKHESSFVTRNAQLLSAIQSFQQNRLRNAKKLLHAE